MDESTKSSPAEITTAARPLYMTEREYLLRSATHDAKQAVECMDQGDWLRADILLKLAVDQIADAGVLP